MFHVDTMMDIQRREAELARRDARHAQARHADGPAGDAAPRTHRGWRPAATRVRHALEALHLSAGARGAGDAR